MLSQRQTELLKLIIEDFIKTAHPIGSKSLEKTMKCSSATIRNEMSLLEDLGYLEKTHTSSGRIPSDKGYRYYVDHIMIPKELNGDDMLKLQTIFHNQSLVLDDVILRSMEIISELTNYTSVVLGKSSTDNKVAKIEVVPIGINQMIAIIITDKGHVENKKIMIPKHVSKDEIRKTIDLINKLIIGVPVNEVSKVLEFDVKPVIGKYVKQHEALYNAFYNAFSDFSDTNIKMSGAKNILTQPEFNDLNKVRKIIDKFDDKNIVKTIKEDSSEVKVYIGSETDFDNDVSVIKTNYYNNGEEGTIALIGPKRMEYGKATTLLNYIKDNLEKRQ